MTPAAGVERAAPAKVNLCLAVDRPDASGMHPIASWMAPLDLADTLVVNAAAPGRASLYNLEWADDAPRQSPIDWPLVNDLAVRAHHALEREVGRTLPVRMRVIKRIPVGAGLGGGSSDAAAALVALRDLFDLEIDDDGLRTIGHALGSDVPFFLGDGPALVQGLGERIERTAPPTVEGEPGAVVLAIPDAACPTGPVYRAFDEIERATPFRDVEAAQMARSGAIDPGDLFNDLAEAAMRVAPRVREAREALAEALGRPAHVTGSGSAVFVVCAVGEAPELGERASRITGCAIVMSRIG